MSSFIAMPGPSFTVRVINPLAPGAIHAVGSVAGTTMCTAFSPDGSLLAVGHQTAPFLRIMRTSDWSFLGGTPNPGNHVYTAEFSPDGAYLAVGTVSAPSARVYRTSDWTLVSGVPSVSGATNNLAWSPDGTLLAVGNSSTPYFRVFDTATWAVVPSLSAAAGASATNWSATGQFFVIGYTSSPWIGVYDTSDWSQVAITVNAAAVRATVFSRSGALLAIGNGNAIRLYRTDTWALERTWSLGTGVNVTALAFSPEDAEIIAACSASPWIRRYRVSDGAALASPTVAESIAALAWSIDLDEPDTYAQRVWPYVKRFGMSWSGPDKIRGVVKARVGSIDVAQRARVRLLRARDQKVVGRTWSDADSGAYAFDGFDARQRFIALAEHPTNPDNPSAEAYMRPVAGVSKKRGEA